MRACVGVWWGTGLALLRVMTHLRFDNQNQPPQFYLPEARTDPQKALTALMADYSLACGGSEAAR